MLLRKIAKSLFNLLTFFVVPIYSDRDPHHHGATPPPPPPPSGDGPLVYGLITKTSNYSLQSTDSYILVNATSGNVTITLPAPTETGRVINMKRIDSSANTVKLRASSGQIDASSEVSFYPYQSTVVIANGSNWFIL